MSLLADLWRGLDARGMGTDKGSTHSYLEVYERLLWPYRLKAHTKVLELGLFRGHSMLLWEAYFHGDAEIHGVDCSDQPHGGMADLRPMIAEGTHRIHLLDCTSREQLEATFGAALFDVVIDDASHNVDCQFASYAALRDKLAPGGVYVVEDVADIDADHARFEAIDPERRVEILDRRSLKGRFDDVLVVIRG